jgi:class I fructose-bisphosphate aldolase
MTHQELITIIGDQSDNLLKFECNKLPKKLIKAPSGNHVAQIFRDSDRPKAVISNLERLYKQGRLGGTGYLSIFPVDQGMEHTAGFSFAANPEYFDPETIVKFAIEGECNAVASTSGALGIISNKYARKIPLIVKLNHSEHLTLPALINQIPFASVQKAYDMGAAGVGATIYFGSDQSHRQIEEVAAAFEAAHRLGMFTVLWCYPRNPNYLKGNKDYGQAIDVTAQACHIGVTIGADIIKQKMPKPLSGFKDLSFSKYSDELYDKLLTENPIDLIRYQVANCFAGRISLINSGGESKGESDLQEAVINAVINKRGGGSGLIMGRKLFKKSFEDGLKIIRAAQDVYLDPEITVA